MKGENIVCVKMWGSVIGYIYQAENGSIYFSYDKYFIDSGIEISPIKMPLSNLNYSFPNLPEHTFYGLPGMVADSLPDRFGTIVMNKYLESQGRSIDSLSVVEKLCYTGKRGMGALEYEPNIEVASDNDKVDIDALTKLAADILSEKEKFQISGSNHMMAQLMECSSSVGGARAKTLIAWNPSTNDVRSGQVAVGGGYEYWLLKFDSIKNNRDKEVSYGSTLYGPHKDDFNFMLNDDNLKLIGSQSQQKLSVLVFKLAEIELFYMQTDEYPILLLDDIFSELDDKRKNNVLSYLKEDIQTFITTTDINNINNEIVNNAKIFKISNCEITEL